MLAFPKEIYKMASFLKDDFQIHFSKFYPISSACRLIPANFNDHWFGNKTVVSGLLI